MDVVRAQMPGVVRAGRLYYGDNLEILRDCVRDESVDLVYLDPPFNSNRLYSVTRRDRPDVHEMPAFDDAWTWNTAARATYDRLAGTSQGVPEKLTILMASLHAFLGPSNMLAYLAMMAARLVELRRVLKPTGSILVHCDATASHYLKITLDALFGQACFKNEVIWRYRRWPTKSRRFQRMHDVLLYYSARPDNAHTFHTLYGYEQLAASTLKTFGTKKQRADFSSGHRKPGVDDEDTAGPPMSDVWDVGIIAPISKERTGYPTQKPLALLERVILACSNEGDVVLDPFCGCGTTIEAAHKFGRRWIGIDVAQVAIEIIEGRLAKRGVVRDVHYTVTGEVSRDGGRRRRRVGGRPRKERSPRCWRG